MTRAEIVRLDRRVDGVDETLRALSDILLEVRDLQDEHSTAIQSIRHVQGEHGGILAQHSSTLEQHSAILEQHTAILEQHTAILEQHSAILEQHSAILAQHSVMLERHSIVLDQHTVALAALDRKVDAVVAQLGEVLRRLPAAD